MHKRGERVVIFSRNGHDFTHRFPEIRDSIACLATHTAILDAVIIACDHQGLPDFRALMSGAKHGLCAWCFDLMALEGRDLRSRPLLERKIHLRHLLAKTDDERLRYSEEFDDPDQLLAAASRAESRRHRVKARRSAVSLRQEPRLDQGQNSDLARGEPGPVADV